jgi:hypothetical protein
MSRFTAGSTRICSFTDCTHVPAAARPLHLQAHATVTTRFRADGSGTYYYWGTLGKPLEEREGTTVS